MHIIKNAPILALLLPVACADDVGDVDGNEEIGSTMSSESTDEPAQTTADTVDGIETTTDTAGSSETTTDSSTTTTDTSGTSATETDAETSTGTDTSGDTTTDSSTSTTGSSTDEGTTTTSTTGNNGCQAPPSYDDCDGQPGALTNDPWRAIGVNCPGDATNSVQAANAVMHSNNPNAWRVAAQFGSANGQNPNYMVPNFNGKIWAANPGDLEGAEVVPSNTSTAILILSTGVVAAANSEGRVTENNSQAGNGDNGNVDVGGLPTPFVSAARLRFWFWRKSLHELRLRQRLLGQPLPMVGRQRVE